MHLVNARRLVAPSRTFIQVKKTKAAFGSGFCRCVAKA
nr:MAG TPA: Protein of unknown function (DUF1244) [Caudoviricetes sp.]